jgi:hypothetical protein
MRRRISLLVPDLPNDDQVELGFAAAEGLDVDRVLRATASSCWRCSGDVSILANIDPWQTSL